MINPKNIQNKDFEIPNQLYNILLKDEFIIYKLKSINSGEYLFITNRRIHKFEVSIKGQIGPISIALNSIKLITFKNRRQTELNDIGTIKIISESFKFDKENEILINNVQDLLNTVKVLESIIYYYGNVKERLDHLNTEMKIKIPHDFKLNEELWIEINNSKKKKNIILNLSIISIIICILCFLLTITQERIINYAPFFVILLLFCWIIHIASKERRNALKKILSPEKNTILRLKEKEFVFMREQFSLSTQFNPNLYINTSSIKFLSNIFSEKYFGVIKIKKTFEDTEKFKFGPIADFLNILEYIFLSIILWKSEMGYLMPKEELSNVKESPIKKKEKVEQNRLLSAPVFEINEFTSLEAYLLSKDISLSYINYLNPNEKVLLFYEPQINTKIYKYIFSIGIISFIFIVIMGIFTSYRILSIIPFIPLILLAVTGIIFSLFFFPSFDIKKSYKNFRYVFTDQKLIIILHNYFIIYTLYDNIASLTRSDKKEKYNITINLKSEYELNFEPSHGRFSIPLVKNIIFIPNIPKENDLFLKIQQFKDLHP